MKENRFFLLEEDGRSLTVVNGIVTAISHPTPLKNAPDNWLEILITWERVLKNYGIQRNFTTPLELVREAAFIARYIINAQNYERKIFFLNDRLSAEVTSTQYRLKHNYFYKGELDLGTAKNNDTRVVCNIMEGSLARMLKANEGTAYEIPFDEDAVNVTMDGIILPQSARFIMPEFETETTQYIMPISLISRDQASSSNVALFSSTFTPFFGGPTYNFSSSQNYFYTAPVDVTIRIQGKIKVTSEGSYSFWIVGSLNTAIDPTNYPSEPSLYYIEPAVAAGTHEFDFDITLNVPAQEKLFFYTNHPFDTKDTYLETDITISYEYRTPTTIVKAFHPFTLFKKIIKLITGFDTYAVSTLLQLANESDKLITCGDALRGIDGAKIKITLNQFYDHINVCHFAGQGIKNNTIEIETRPYFFNASDPIYLGIAKNPEDSFASDLMGNKVKIGWQEPNIEDVNGKYAFNGSHLYSSNVTKFTSELSFVSPFSADPYEIEIIRINLEGKTTTDSSSDNKNYCIHANTSVTKVFSTNAVFTSSGNAISLPLGLLNNFAKGQRIKITGSASNGKEYTISNVQLGFFTTVINVNETVTDEASVAITLEILTGFIYSLFRDTYDSITGVPNSSVFNGELSPKRLLLKHGPWLRSVFHPFDNQKLIFRSTERNADLKTVKGSVTVQENSDQLIASLGQRMFIPRYLEFECPVPYNIVQLLEENPNRCFSITAFGELFVGFNTRVSIEVNTLKEQKVKLLLAPDTDLNKLIF